MERTEVLEHGAVQRMKQLKLYGMRSAYDEIITTAIQRNAVLIGGTGTGKTHLAVAIARACIRNGARGRFFNVVDRCTGHW